jgi:hypothetical protein
MHAVIDAFWLMLAPLTEWLSRFNDVLWGERSPYAALFALVVLGGWAAWTTGKACARTWRPAGTLVLYLFFVALAVRFVHFALFGAPLLVPIHFLVDLAVSELFGFAGYRATRARQMARQYGWRYVVSGPFDWRLRD